MRVELIDEPLPQPFARGSGALSSKRQMFRSANDPTFLREMLDAIELEDQIEGFLSDRSGRQRCMKVAAKMSVARSALATRDVRYRIVAAVRVDEQRAFGAAEYLAWCLSAAARGEDERTSRSSRMASEWLEILFWDRNGFVLYLKRLERGRFQLPVLDPKRFGPGSDARTCVRAVS